MKTKIRWAATAAATISALALAACAPENEQPGFGQQAQEDSALSGELNGAGASSQESAMGAWRAAFQGANPEVTINYDPVGSGGGRTQFLDSAVSFAGTDSLMDSDEYAQAVERCDGTEGAIHLPMYISPIAVIFNLDDVASLNMTPGVIARIFDGAITRWDDPAITAENPGVRLPDLAITTVHRADESGTTKNFTDYLAKASSDWPYDPSGEWPNGVGEAGPGTSQVVSIVQQNTGAIGYADASRAGELGTVAIGVGDAFVPFSPQAAATAVDSSAEETGNGPHDLRITIDRTTTAPGAYPLVLVSYHVVCQQYDDAAEGNLVVAFLRFIASGDGQNTAALNAGSSPISPTLGARIGQALDAIRVG